jgi:hypothetical protein
MNNNNNNNINNINNINNNEYSNIVIDNRILPLFSNPIILKQISDQEVNKINLDQINPEKKLTYKVISFKEILELYLKGLNIYNLNLNNYLIRKNKLDLILTLNKNDEYYKLNLILSNYFYKVRKFIPVVKLKSLLYNIRLFLPSRLLKPEPHIRFRYRLREIVKIFLFEDIYKLNLNKRSIKINRRQLRKLIETGKTIKTELDYLIIQQTNKINKLKIEQKLPSSQIYTSLIESNTNKELKKIQQLLKTKLANSLEIAKNNSYSLLLQLNEKNLIINKIFKSINNTNQIKIEQTMNSILKNKNTFNYKNDSISLNSNPVSLVYVNNNSSAPSLRSLKESSAVLALLPTAAVQQAGVARTCFARALPYGNIGQGALQKKPILNQYLKSISIYNLNIKGIFIFYSNIIGFNFNSETNKLIKNIYNLLASSFKSMYCLISKPVFVITPDKIIIQLFYYLFIPNILKFKKLHKALQLGYYKNKILNKRRKLIKKQYSKFRKIKINVRIKLRKLSNISLIKVFPDKLKQLCDILSNLFKKPVELDLIRLHYPYNDSNILVNLLGIMINKIKLRIIIRKLFKNAVIKNLNKITGKTKLNIIPAFLSGITIRVAGRLLTHRVIPRKTIKITRRGASARGKINYSDVARYTNKNKRGAYSITVSSGQNYFN